MGSAALTVRRVRLDYPEDFDPCWQPHLVEFCCLANAVSLLMPYAEPFVVRSVRAVVEDLPEPLAGRARAYAGQEANHHGQHRRLNDRLARRYRGVRTLEAIMAFVYRALSRSTGGRLGGRLGTAHAAGFETVAFAMARWIDPRLDRFFEGADPTAASLFLWHLAEEAEHKGVAWDVHRASGGGRLSYGLGLLLALGLVGVFTFAATVVLLAGEHRLLRPRSWGRLVGWLAGFSWEAGALVVLSLGAHHHPDGLRDPARLRAWLDEYDATA